MRINVTLVGYLAQVGLPSGFKGGIVDLSEGARVSDLFQTIGLPLPMPNLTVRKNQIIDLGDLLSEGDNISVIPPIGGGSR
jgi:molybdopterin converting factor small subunit